MRFENQELSRFSYETVTLEVGTFHTLLFTSLPNVIAVPCFRNDWNSSGCGEISSMSVTTSVTSIRAQRVQKGFPVFVAVGRDKLAYENYRQGDG